MTTSKMIRLRGLRVPIMLAVVLSLPASTTALSIAASDIGSDIQLEPTRPVDGPATPSVWDPAPTIIVRPVAPKPAPPERPLGANPLWAIPLATLSDTRERPIFSASRRPPAQTPVATIRPAAPSPPPPPRAERPPLSLVGTVAGDSESFGIFVDRGTSTALRLRVGEDYQGWRLRNVSGRDVALERDQQTVVLSLPQPGTEAAAPMPASAAMPGNSTMQEEQAPSLPRKRGAPPVRASTN